MKLRDTETLCKVVLESTSGWLIILKSWIMESWILDFELDSDPEELGFETCRDNFQLLFVEISKLQFRFFQ